MKLKTNTIKQMITYSKRESRKEDVGPLGKPQKKSREIHLSIYTFLATCNVLCTMQYTKRNVGSYRCILNIHAILGTMLAARGNVVKTGKDLLYLLI